MNIAAARNRSPRWWLFASLAFGLLTYLTVSYPEGGGATPWIAIDLLLVFCIWRGSRRALNWYRLLQTLGLVLVTCLWLLSLFTRDITVYSSAWSLVPYALSVWCAYAPALTDHVAAPDLRPDQHQPS